MKWLSIIALLLLTGSAVEAKPSVELTEDNFRETISSAKLVNVNFYVHWCHFSRMLAPVWEATAVKMDSNNDVVFARVDCDHPKAKALCGTYNVNKYPTMRTFMDGILLKREYRKERTVDAISSYTSLLLENPVHPVHSIQEYEDAIKDHNNVITAVVQDLNGPVVKFMGELAKTLRDDCYFVVSEDKDNQIKTKLGVDQTLMDAFVYTTLHDKEVIHPMTQAAEDVKAKVRDFCDPLVRKLTFDRAEEYTERGLPFFILFHAPEDKDSVEKFYKQLNENFQDERKRFLFLTADAQQFSHPLHHIGRTSSDVPIIALDSFKHMYRLEFEDFLDIAKLKQFFDDFQSGAAHERWHQNESQLVKEQLEAHRRAAGGADHKGAAAPEIPDSPDNKREEFKPVEKKIDPVAESAFKKLEPRANRYSFKYNHDEL
eukprot:Nk52_evm1s1613 gene=Nk52_evmTU1s1613